MENYQYMEDRSAINLVSLIHYRTNRNLYTEFRYNYEELHTASLYGGKSIIVSGDGKSSVTPMVGLVLGKYTGGSIALNTDLEYRKFFYSSQSQFTAHKEEKSNNFFYNWSEAGYYVFPWFYTGVTMQQTLLAGSPVKTAAGFTAGFLKNKWSVPFYLFNPGSPGKYFIVGINFEWEQPKKNK